MENELDISKLMDDMAKREKRIMVNNRKGGYFLLYMFLILVHLFIVIPVVFLICYIDTNHNPLLIIGTIVELLLFSNWLIKSIRKKNWENVKIKIPNYEKDKKVEKVLGIIYFSIMTFACGFCVVYMLMNISHFDGEMIFAIIVMIIATIYCGYGLASMIDK